MFLIFKHVDQFNKLWFTKIITNIQQELLLSQMLIPFDSFQALQL